MLNHPFDHHAAARSRYRHRSDNVAVPIIRWAAVSLAGWLLAWLAWSWYSEEIGEAIMRVMRR